MFNFFKGIIGSPVRPSQPGNAPVAEESPNGRKVLNVGGNDRNIPIPAQYDGWVHVLLDIDPKCCPDIVCDARELTDLPDAGYDSIYCSHNLEHYYRHDVKRVLAGFHHVLKEDGFAYIRVPDMGCLMQMVVQRDLDIDDDILQSPAGLITVNDIIYGYGKEIERSGQDFYAHKTGFTQKSLTAVLLKAGFHVVFTRADNLAVEITAIAFKRNPSDQDIELFKLSEEFSAVYAQTLSAQTSP
jgi:SAM-dependent methyltransferase